MSEPRITAAITRHRASLAAREADTVREMRALYERTLNRMAGEIDKLEGELRAIYDAGDVPTIGRLYRTGRVRSLVAQAAIEFERYGHGVEALTEAATRDAVRRAQADALELTKIVMGEPPPGVVADALFSKLPTDAIEAMVATTRSGPLAQLLRSFGAMASVDARNALIAGIALGEHPSKVAKRLRDALGTSLSRASTIARTEQLRAYREGHRRWYDANSKVVKAYVWHSALGRNTCVACWSMHGTEFDTKEPMGTHPNCRCAMVPKTKTWRELGYSTTKESSAEIERGTVIFRRLKPADQLHILGPKSYRAYRAGEVDIDHFVRLKRTDDWGVTRSRASLKQAQRRAARAGYKGPVMDAPGLKPAKPAAPRKPKGTNRKPGEFLDLDEAKAWASGKYGHIEFDFEGMHIDAINPTLAQFDRLADEWPDVAARLKYMGGYQGQNRPFAYKWSNNTWAHASRDGRRLGLNPRWYGDPDALKAGLKGSADIDWSGSRWHPEGCNTLESILTHEYGHQVANWLESVPTDAAHLPYYNSAGTGLVRDTFRQWFNSNKATKTLSRYASSNRDESWAEGFAAIYHGTDAAKDVLYVRRQRALIEGIGKPDDWHHDPKPYNVLPADERTAEFERISEFEKKVNIK